MKEVRVLVGKMVTTVKRALPAGSPTDAETFCQIAMTTIIANLSETVSSCPKDWKVDDWVHEKALVFASDGSIQRVIAQAAELDLQPGSALGYCWFIRRGDIATFMVGVNGYVQLLLRHPNIVKVHADVIFEADECDVVRGEKPTLIHKPAWTKEPRKPVTEGGRGNRLGAYAVATFRDGSTDFCLMNAYDLERAHSKSAAPNSPAYRDWPEEMDQRSAIKRAQKRWPKSLEFQRALELDESETLREDLADAVRTVETSAQTIAQAPVSKQRAALDSLTRELSAGGVNAMGGARAAEGASVGK